MSVDWKKDLGEWLPLRTRDGQMRVNPDSPDRAPRRDMSESARGTPRHQPISGSLTALDALGGGGSTSFLLSATDVPATVPSSSIPFFFPSSNNNNNNNNSGGFFDFLSGQQNDDDVVGKQINAPYFVPELLEPSPITSSSTRNPNSRNATTTTASNIGASQQQNHEWIAFAPISPEEVNLAVATIVGTFPSHTISRYCVERTLTSRFNLPPSKATEPTVLALYLFTKSRENALHVLHRHERSPLFKGVYGDVRCALTAAPSYSLACGVLNPFVQQAHLKNNQNSVENSVSLQLAAQAGRGNVSVCRRLEITQVKPLKVRMEIWIRKYSKKVVYAVVAIVVAWYFLFYF